MERYAFQRDTSDMRTLGGFKTGSSWPRKQTN